MFASGMVSNFPMYDGSGNLSDFMKQFKIYGAIFTWNEAKQAEIVPNFLKGKAKRVYDMLDDQKKKSMDEIEKALKAGCTKPKDVLLREFHSRQPQPGESPMAYAIALQELLQLALPDLNEKDREPILRLQFMNNMPQDVRSLMRVASGSGKTWNEMLKLIEETCMDQDLPKVSIKSEPSDGMELNKMRTYGRPQQQQRFYQQPQQHRFYQQPQQASFNHRPQLPRSNSSNGACWYCGIKGHKQADCKTLLRDEERANGRDRYNKNRQQSNRHPSEQTPSRRQERPSEHRESRPQKSTIQSFKVSADTNPGDEEDDEYETDDQLASIFGKTLVLNTHEMSGKVGLLRLDATIGCVNTPNKFETKVLVDGGASHSFIQLAACPRQIQKLVLAKSNPLNLVRKSYKLETATVNSPIECLLGTFRIKIGNWSGVHDFVITNEVKSEKMIVGRDFLKKYNVKVDHGGDTIELTQIENERCDFKQMACVLDSDVNIPAQTQKLIKAKLSKMSLNRMVLFEPMQQMNENGLLFAKSVDKVNDDGEITLSVINASDVDVKLSKNKTVGKVEPIVEEDIVDEMKDVPEAKPNPKLDDQMKANLMKLRTGCITVEQKKLLMSLLAKYYNCFKWSENEKNGLTNLIEHHIVTTTPHPIKQRQYRLPQSAKEEVEKQIQTMLKEDVIEESTSPWSSPILIVKKKSDDGKPKFRFCIDFRKLNQVTVKDAYPLPRIDDTIEALSGSKYFTTLDLSSGYWQVPLSKLDREKTAFQANFKLWQCKVMPYGVCNGPPTFQRLMDRLLHGMTWYMCLVYIDDVIVYSVNFDQQLIRLEAVFTRIQKANLKLNPYKCHFCTQEVSYLGFQISSKGIHPDPKKIEVVREMPKPSTAPELVRFLGALSYYRRFIRNFSATASVLYRMVESKEKFKWSEESEYAFQKLKSDFVSAPILVYPNYKLPFKIECDASEFAIGAVLLQEVNRVNHPIAFASRHLTKVERRYSVSEKELLAIVWAAKQFYCYIYGRPIEFVTDHKPLADIKSLKEPHGRLGKLRNKLEGMEYTITYKPGHLNKTADFLSRLEHTAKLNMVELSSNVDWKVEQCNDENLFLVKKLVQEKKSRKRDWSNVKNGYQWFKVKDKLQMRDGLLYYVVPKVEPRVVVPSQLVGYVCRLFHDDKCSGHLGTDKMFHSMYSRFYWPNMYNHVRAYCGSCDMCQKYKYGRQLVAPLSPISVNRTWQLIGVDLVGPLVQTRSGNIYILVAIDYFSKYCEVLPIRSMTAEVTAQFLFHSIICRYGAPEMIITDQGKNFDSNVVKELCKLSNIVKIRTTSYHQQGNGLVERMIKTLKQMIIMYINQQHNDWDVHLQQLVSAYNNSVHASTGLTPYEILFGRNCNGLLSIATNSQMSTKCRSAREYLGHIQHQQNIINSIVQGNLESARERQKKYYDKFISSCIKFKERDLVLLSNKRTTVGRSRSFEPKYIGPYVVVSRVNDLLFKVATLDGKKSIVVHVNRMVHYTERDPAVFGSGQIPIVSKQQPVKSTESSVNDTNMNVMIELALLKSMVQCDFNSSISTVSDDDDELGLGRLYMEISDDESENMPFVRANGDGDIVYNVIIEESEESLLSNVGQEQDCVEVDTNGETVSNVGSRQEQAIVESDVFSNNGGNVVVKNAVGARTSSYGRSLKNVDRLQVGLTKK